MSDWSVVWINWVTNNHHYFFSWVVFSLTIIWENRGVAKSNQQTWRYKRQTTYKGDIPKKTSKHEDTFSTQDWRTSKPMNILVCDKNFNLIICWANKRTCQGLVWYGILHCLEHIVDSQPGFWWLRALDTIYYSELLAPDTWWCESDVDLLDDINVQM